MSSEAPRIIKQAQMVSQPYWLGQSGTAELSELQRQHSEIEALRLETENSCRQQILQTEKQISAMMNEAREEAVRLLQEAQQKVQQIQEQAHSEGLRRGESEGRAKLTQALEQTQAVLLGAQQDRARMLAETEAEVVHLVLQVVRKILKIEPIINEQVLTRVIRDALERLGQRVDVNIYVNPQDVELLHYTLSQIQDLALEIVIEADEQVEPGGCRVSSQAGEIDARLSSQFEAVARSFLALAEGSENQIE